VWHAVGLLVREQMEQRKGVRLEKFGSFSFDIMGDPCFNVSTEFKRTYRVRQVAIPTHDNTPISKLNMTQLGRMSGTDRNLTERLYDKCISVFGTGIRTGQNALLTIHRVAEIFVNNDSVKCAFMSEFIETISQKMSIPKMKQITRPASAPRTSNRESNQLLMDSPASSMRARPSTPSRLQSKSKSNAKAKPIQGKKHIPQPRSENPITGEESVAACDPRTGKKFGGDYHPSNRNPIFGDESPRYTDKSFDHSFSSSPRPSSRSGPAPRRGGQESGFRPPTPTRRPGTPTRADMNTKRPGTPNRADVNMRRPGTPTRADDPRTLAARAIGSGQIMETIRKKITERGGVNGIKGFVRLINIMDNNGDKRLTREELMYGMRDYGINISKTELEQLFILFDRDRNGFIDVDEFLIGIRGDLSDRRKQLVRMAFDILDTDGSGYVTIDELSAVYDVSWAPAVRSGKQTPAEAMKEFMSQWDRLDGDGVISFEEFVDYYKGVSSSIDGDDYFELMIRNAWRIAGGVGMAANTANKRVLVTNRDGSQSIATVEHELGMKAGDKDAVRSRLARQGIDAASVELHGGLDTTEKPTRARPQLNERSVPKQAWSEVAHKAPQQSQDQNAAEIIRHSLYDPPVSLEQLASKFRLSLVGGNPSLTKTMFLQRFDCCHHSPCLTLGGRMAQLDPQLSKGVLVKLWEEVTQSSSSTSMPLADIHNYLSNRYGKDKSTKSGGVVERAIAKIVERSGGGLKGLQR
jgi:Ca2+-binding EF-hand superfamily protein